MTTTLPKQQELRGEILAQAEIEDSERAGSTNEERAEMKEHQKENRELRRSNEILKSASFCSRRSSTTHLTGSPLHPRHRGKSDVEPICAELQVARPPTSHPGTAPRRSG